MLWVLCCFPSATVGCFACSFALVNLVFMEWSRSVSFRLLVVAVSSAHVFSDRAFNFFKVVLTICLEIQCNSPNKYFDLPCPHLYARCFQCQICGHYAWDCKRHFFQLCRYALSVSFNRLFPLRPLFYSTETAGQFRSFSPKAELGRKAALLPVLPIPASGNTQYEPTQASTLLGNGCRP